MFSSVDLPEPEGPTIAMASPRSTVRSTPRRAWTGGSVPNVRLITVAARRPGRPGGPFAVRAPPPSLPGYGPRVPPPGPVDAPASGVAAPPASGVAAAPPASGVTVAAAGAGRRPRGSRARGLPAVRGVHSSGRRGGPRAGRRLHGFGRGGAADDHAIAGLQRAATPRFDSTLPPAARPRSTYTRRGLPAPFSSWTRTCRPLPRKAR